MPNETLDPVVQEALAGIQRQIDALALAHDARAEAAQAAFDDLKDIVCDPANARNHESRITAVETRTDRIETEQDTARRERRGIFDSLPSGEEVGKLGEGVRKWGFYGVVIAFGLALVYLLVVGDPITAIERLHRLFNPPVQVEVTNPVPVVPAPVDTTR
ncbi:MAG: hypothetical protein LCH53_04185 [Bacteroidetes bacterium]|nr:hypothetical protein [Bacteroidota bacterium]